jgi:hypothetical protein
MSKYLVRRASGVTDGPFSSSQLRELAYEGRLTAADEISPMGETRWVSASKVGGIKEILEMLSPPEADARHPELQPEPAPPTPVSGQPVHGSPQSVAAPDLPVQAVPLHAQARHETPKRYGMLRFGASSLAAYGWLLMGLCFIAAVACSGVVLFEASNFPWILILSIFVGFGYMLFMRNLAKSTEYAGSMIIIVFLPALAATAAAIRDGANSVELFIGYAAQSFIITGSLFSTVMIALFVIALGEYFTAHADMATNSWHRRASL